MPQLNERQAEAQAYTETLWSMQYPEPWEYLHGRGLTDATIRSWGVGYCADELSLFGGRVTFPICDFAGNLVSLGGRSINGDLPKYYYASGWSKTRYLYGTHLLPPTPFVVMVEGQIDAWMLTQIGYPTVAVMGSNVHALACSVLPIWTSGVVVYPDNVSSDEKAFEKAIKWLDVIKQVGLEAVFPRRPYPDATCGDPDELARKNPGWLSEQISECAGRLREVRDTETLTLEEVDL